MHKPAKPPSKTLNDLELYFYHNQKKVIHKWAHYFEIYDRFFQKFKDNDVNFLEIGVDSGGSLQMWSNYFSEDSKICGIDINPLSYYKEKNIEVHIGSQDNTCFLNSVVQKYEFFDIILDDAYHQCPQQIISFEFLFPFLKDGGFYLCEDTHTSYMEQYGGSARSVGGFVEYAKNLIDQIHFEFNKKILTTNIAKSIHSINFFNSMVVIEKKEFKNSIWMSTGRENKPSKKNIKMI